ncbi:MAG: AP2/ERF family transcription factor [Nitrospira sp.]
MTRRAQCSILKKNNRSGVSGVTRSVVKHRWLKAVGPTVYWVARWPGPNGIPTQRRFSVKRFGEWGAFLKAVEARRHGLACLDELPPTIRCLKIDPPRAVSSHPHQQITARCVALDRVG